MPPAFAGGPSFVPSADRGGLANPSYTLINGFTSAPQNKSHSPPRVLVCPFGRRPGGRSLPPRNEAGGRGAWRTRRPHLGRRKVLGQKTYRAIRWLCRKANNRRKEGRLARSLDEADNLVQNGRRCQHGGIRLARCADRHHCHCGRVDRRSKRVEGVLNDRRIVGQHQLDLPPPTRCLRPGNPGP
jgi:hypothetical protein